MAHVLLIDDDPLFIAEQVRQALPADTVAVATTGADGVAAFRSRAPDVVLLDLHLPDGSGLDVFAELRALDARVPVLFITVARTADAAIEAMKRGAFNYVYKPLELDRLQAAVLEALDVAQRMRAPVAIQQTPPHSWADDTLCGTCPAMLEVYKDIGRVAQQNVTVLVTGESGTGKELVARAIYQHSARSKATFLALNCAAIPENLLESELFGHERGAFTGADRRRIGKFEQHSGGTILLDEIGDMPLPLQAKVLRLLQHQTFERMGGNETIHSDVRLIASTHRDLQTLVEEGKFRLDLYYRLGVFTIHLAPLRERGVDIALLVQHYVRRFSRELGREVCNVAPEAMARLNEYSWPGNIRELQNVLKQAVLNAQGTTLLPGFLPPLTTRRSSRPPPSAPAEVPRRPTSAAVDVEHFVRERLTTRGGDLYSETRRYVDRFLLTVVLEHTNGNFRAATEVLGISRQTLRARLRALGISVAHSVELDENP
ncbi:MAG: sigma-54 dependent transcriptional regulator [Polyangiaceae bacterium]